MIRDEKARAHHDSRCACSKVSPNAERVWMGKSQNKRARARDIKIDFTERRSEELSRDKKSECTRPKVVVICVVVL